MSIKDFQVPTESVSLPGGASFSVRGLSLDDLTQLIQKHRPALESVFNKFEEQGDVSIEMTASLIEGMVSSFPGLVAMAIALAADEPDTVEKVMKFPTSVQIDAAEKLGRLTFASEGGLKNVLATVVKIIRGGRESIEALGTSFSSGTAATA